MKPLRPPRSPDRIEPMLALIRELWVANPDWRLGQLVSNVIPHSRDPYYVEDDELAKGLNALKAIQDELA